MKNDLYTRNWLFIDEKLQREISNKKILIAGTGLGSFVAELAVRTGFLNLIIADGDTVSLSNLNRQSFLRSDIGINKSKALAKKLKAINPKVNLEVLNKFLTKEDLAKLIPKVDYVINTIDFDSPDFVECSNLCRKHGKVELFPTNLGFGGSVIVFNKKSKTFSEYFKSQNDKILKKKILDHLILKQKVSKFLKKKYLSYLDDPKPYDPQLGVSSLVTASMIITLIIKMIQQEKVKTFPYVHVVDLYK